MFDAVVALIAALGFILSIYSLYLQRRDRRIRLRVKAGGFFVVPDSDEGEGSSYEFIVEINNVSDIPANLAALNLRPSSKSDRLLASRDRPHFNEGADEYRMDGCFEDSYRVRVEPHSRLDLSADMSHLAAAMKRAGMSGKVPCTVDAVDSTGTRHKGTETVIDLEAWTDPNFVFKSLDLPVYLADLREQLLHDRGAA